jgi:phenylalanyl-tRNA synthetase beta subunit
MKVFQHRQWWDSKEHKPSAYISERMYRPYSDYPFIIRDITVENYDNVLADIIGNAAPYLEVVWEMGEYKPKNTITYRLIFQAIDKTLTDDEVNKTMKKIYEVCTR